MSGAGRGTPRISPGVGTESPTAPEGVGSELVVVPSVKFVARSTGGPPTKLTGDWQTLATLDLPLGTTRIIFTVDARASAAGSQMGIRLRPRNRVEPVSYLAGAGAVVGAEERFATKQPVALGEVLGAGEFQLLVLTPPLPPSMPSQQIDGPFVQSYRVDGIEIGNPADGITASVEDVVADNLATYPTYPEPV